MTGMSRAAVRIPNGDMFTFIAQQETMDSYSDYMYYESASLTNLWRYLKDQFGEIPAGTYTLSYYFNTDYFGYKDFKVIGK